MVMHTPKIYIIQTLSSWFDIYVSCLASRQKLLIKIDNYRICVFNLEKVRSTKYNENRPLL